MSKKRIKQETPSNIYMLPIAFVITIVPLIVYMKAVKLSPIEIDNWFGKPTYADFFNYYKSQWLIAGSVMALVFFFVYGLLKGFTLKKSFIYIPAAVYALFIIISTICSRDVQVAINGFVAHNEGMLALLSYLSLFLVTFNIVRTESQIRFLLGALLISASIIGIIGILQFAGMDIFRTDFGKRMILPNQYHKMSDSVSFKFEESMIFSTLSNPNYIGSYTVLLIPIAFLSFICFKKTYLKVGTALLTVILAVCLIGSRSRAGLVGLAFSLILTLVIFRKLIFKRKLVAVISIVGILVLFLGANFVLKGVLVNRILAEFNPESQVNQFFDLQDIIFEENKVSIVSSTEKLVIQKEDNYLAFYDDNGVGLKYSEEKVENQSQLKFDDPRYEKYLLNIENDIITINQEQVRFKLRVTEESFALIGINSDVDQIEKADSIGFKGNERFGSARGYIWSRTFPLLINSPVLGYGPDMFTIEFPQDDYIGKIRAYGTAQMIVDKPHNMFLQVAFSSGVPSLIAFLVLLGFYLIQSIKLYMKDLDKSYMRLMGSGIFIAICGYLTAGLFNDSTVAVAPIFWVLLGLGFVCNTMIKKGSEVSKVR